MKLSPWIFGCALGLIGAGQAFAQATVMRISHPLPPTHHIAQLIDTFAADVKANTGGKVEVQIFGTEQAFKANQNHAAVARKQIEAGVVTNFQCCPI